MRKVSTRPLGASDFFFGVPIKPFWSTDKSIVFFDNVFLLQTQVYNWILETHICMYIFIKKGWYVLKCYSSDLEGVPI
jgi:hypothetical protein